MERCNSESHTTWRIVICLLFRKVSRLSQICTEPSMREYLINMGATIKICSFHKHKGSKESWNRKIFQTKLDQATCELFRARVAFNFYRGWLCYRKKEFCLRTLRSQETRPQWVSRINLFGNICLLRANLAIENISLRFNNAIIDIAKWIGFFSGNEGGTEQMAVGPKREGGSANEV